VLSHNGVSVPEIRPNVNAYLFTGGVYFVNNFCLQKIAGSDTIRQIRFYFYLQTFLSVLIKQGK
jgi:hypothetical protein